MISPFKLLKTEKLATEVEKDINSMNKSNWKTNLTGILTAVFALALLWAPAQYQEKIQATASILAGIGLVAAKDHNN